MVRHNDTHPVQWSREAAEEYCSELADDESGNPLGTEARDVHGWGDFGGSLKVTAWNKKKSMEEFEKITESLE